MFRNRNDWTGPSIVSFSVILLLIISVVAGFIPILGPLCLGLYVKVPKNSFISLTRNELKCPIWLWLVVIAAVQYVPWALLSDKFVPYFLLLDHNQLALYQVVFFLIPYAAVLLFERVIADKRRI